MRSARLIGPPAIEAAASVNQGGGLGFLSRYFASLTGKKGLVDNDLIGGVFANPRLGRFFSDEAPKKKSMFFCK